MARCEDSSRIQDDLIRAKRYNERDRFLIRAMPRTNLIRVIITFLAFKPMFQTDVSNRCFKQFGGFLLFNRQLLNENQVHQ